VFANQKERTLVRSFVFGSLKRDFESLPCIEFNKAIAQQTWRVGNRPHGGNHEGSNLRLVCECAGVLGGNLWHHIQGDQCVGVCDYLACIDSDPDWHCCAATGNDQKIIREVKTILWYGINISQPSYNSPKENLNMEDLFVVFWWSGPIGLGIFFMGVGVLLWGISKIRNK
jgi:hypothetical protein